MNKSSGLGRPLSALEKAFVEAVERGEVFRPQRRQLRRSSGIRGTLIRAMLLGTPLGDHPRRGPGQEPIPVAVTPQGIRVVGPGEEASEPPAPAGPRSGPPLLRVAGPLDLAGLAGTDGGFLPALELSHCLFEQTIELSGTHLQSLRLDRSRFSRLCAVQASFNGSVGLFDCGPRREPPGKLEREFLNRTIAAVAGTTRRYLLLDRQMPTISAEPCPCALCALPANQREHARYDGQCGFCCDIDFEGAQIGGMLEVSRTYLRAAGIVGRRYVTPKVTDKFAAFLDGVKVGGSIIFERSVFVGRCSLRSAAITNDVWVHGGKFVSSAERATFDFQLATIGGLLIFGAQEATRDETEERHGKAHVRAFPVVIVGHISAVSMRVGEAWIAEGFYFGRDPFRRGGHATINFGKCDVGRTFKVGTYHEVQDPGRASGPAWIQGEISLLAANLGKNLEIHGADYTGIAAKLGLDHKFFRCVMKGADETPHLRLNAQNLKVDRRAQISRGRFRDADPPPSGSRRSRKSAAVDFWKSTIGTGLRLEAPTRSIGAIRLNSCVIGREAIIRCEAIKASPEDRERQRRDRIPCLVDVSESAIDGHLKIGRLFPPAREPAPEDPSQGTPLKGGVALLVEGGISLQSTRVQGSILFGHVMIDLSRAKRVPGEGASRDGLEAMPDTEEEEPTQLRRKTGGEDTRIAIDLRGCECGSDLEVRGMCWKLPKPVGIERPGRLAPEKPAGSAPAGGEAPPSLVSGPGSKAFAIFRSRIGAILGLARFRLIHDGFFAIVDLRGFRCAMLLDGFGADWGLIYRIQLRVAGLKIGDVEPVCHRGHGPASRPEPHRLRWLAHQHTVQPATDQRETTHRKPPRVWLPERFVSTWRDDFVPHAYQVFSSAYRRAGEDLTADRILVEKKDTQNALHFWRLSRRWISRPWVQAFVAIVMVLALVSLRGRVVIAHGQYATTYLNEYWPVLSRLLGLGVLIVLLWPLVISAFQMLFKWLFLYGLSAERGLLVFAVAIGIGWGTVHIWRYGGSEYVTDWSAKAPGGILDRRVILVIEVPPQPSSGRLAIDRRAAGTRAETTPLVAAPSPCNADVSSLIYAVDTFLPLIDLDQERRCTIRSALPGDASDRYFAPRVLKAIYELVGWLVTSLLILTVTGVLRRDLER